ncbi:alpha-glycosidase [Bacillus sp. AFS002410]|uniref:alpha-glycosidase n=1 Tax=Bacillus sp. AFS002410 TaxID=2033481 RepID=UPI000BF12687|nr:alpha-glycosidase [Bacillus sp. AFS002410]PEJ60772.1 alpha-glycosidase [Bacillus sp. AFS002410]
MQIESIYHQPYDQYAFSIDDKTYRIRIRTKKGDCKEVSFYYGDPFKFNDSGWQIESVLSMYLAFSTEFFDYWEINVMPPNKRMKYIFHLRNEQNSIYYGESGFSNQFNQNDQSNCFTLAFLHKNYLISPPKWVNKTIWYQIFPDRFASGNNKNNPSDSIPWGSTLPTSLSYFGGDLEGIIQKIHYLKNLGISGIYLTPIFEANSNHKYNTINYFRVDPTFGDEKILKLLIKKCHENNIRVMLDAVFNHTSASFPPFQDALQNGKNSAFYDWFHFYSENNQLTYETFSFVKEMPKLNTENKEVQNFLIEIGSYWIKEFNIDGWRLDVANEIDHYFWKHFNKKMKEMKNDLFIVGEIWHHAMPWLRGDEFDSVMNYPLMKSLLAYFGYQTISTTNYQNSINDLIATYPLTVIKTLFNVIGSHDTPRILTQCNQNEKRVILLYVFLFTFFGTPCIYYGDEIGLQGGNDPECRSCMLWDQSQYNLTIFDSLKKLIALRNKFSVLANDGEFNWVQTDHNYILMYERKNDRFHFLIIANNSLEKQSVSLPINLKGKRITNLWNGQQFATDSDSIAIDIAETDFLILQFEEIGSFI